MKTSRRISLSLLLGLAACASTERRPRLWSDAPEDALLYAGSAFELRLRGGRVEQLLLPAYPGGPMRVRSVHDIDDLRRVYDATDRPMPEPGAARQIEVNGWVGLACVRAGEACGAAPADLPGVMILLRFE